MTGSQAEGLYTQEQIDYVNGVKDEDLRSHLLHLVRSRDNLTADRDAFEKQAGAWPSIEKSVDAIAKALSEDKSEGSYYYAWQSNIAMAFFDEWNNAIGVPVVDSHQLREIANNAAKSFLDILCRQQQATTETENP